MMVMRNRNPVSEKPLARLRVDETERAHLKRTIPNDDDFEIISDEAADGLWAMVIACPDWDAVERLEDAYR
jgi:hypothetical protein